MTALIIVDVQNDFLPGGALEINGGDEVISRINRLLALPFDTIVATKDWHPADHASFAVNQGKLVGEEIVLDGIPQILWPVHCVEKTFGAEFSADLDTTHFDKIFYKGVNPSVDSYSCFFDNGHIQSTGLDNYLKDKGIHTVFFAGLATDYCVKYSVHDALTLGFEVYVISDACKGVGGACTATLAALEQLGAHLTTTEALVRG